MGSGTQRIPRSADARSSTAKERHALLQRVLWSRHLQNSERTRDLLIYVSERALQEPGAEVHEQEIGHRVFGRSPDYDTTADNIVRVTVSQARKKLEQYFTAEGSAEPLILEIPKGKYTPVFRQRDAAAGEENVWSDPTLRARLAIYRGASVLLAVCLCIGLGVAVWFAAQLHRTRIASNSELERNPAINALWSPLLAGPGAAQIVMADSSLSLFQGLLERQLTLGEYLKPDLWTQAEGLRSNPGLQAFAQRSAQQRFTSLATVTAAYRIAQVAGGDPSRISFVFPRDFNIRQMKSDNVVLLGSSRANPWTELIQDKLNFRFAFDQKSRYAYFENREPRSGEQREFRADANVSYCQIAYLPNLSQTGTILAIIGTEVEGTEGGSEFVTTEASLQQLRRLLPGDHGSRFRYFEALLKSSRFAGSAPSFSIVAVRALTP